MSTTVGRLTDKILLFPGWRVFLRSQAPPTTLLTVQIPRDQTPASSVNELSRWLVPLGKSTQPDRCWTKKGAIEALSSDMLRSKFFHHSRRNPSSLQADG